MPEIPKAVAIWDILVSLFIHVRETMSLISNLTASFHSERAAFNSAHVQFKLRSLASINSKPAITIGRPLQKNAFLIFRVGVVRSSRDGREGSVRMTLINERLGDDRNVAEPSSTLAYELVQGKHVKWSSMVILDRSIPEPPTAILLHGILGSRKNWRTFARRLAQEFPTWQFVLVDLRCHGDSASIKKRGPHTVTSTALDVLKLIAQLRITPRVLIGHSFGGKVVLSMVEQAAKPLARPVRVWVLDATPGKVRAGADGKDHPAELISFLRNLPKEVSSKRDIVNALVEGGFSEDIAQSSRSRLLNAWILKDIWDDQRKEELDFGGHIQSRSNAHWQPRCTRRFCPPNHRSQTQWYWVSGTER